MGGTETRDARRVWASGLLLLLAMASPSFAVLGDSVEGRKLVIVDGGPSGRSKVILTAKGAAVSKGAGTDASSIAASFSIARGGTAGSFSVPAGAISAGGPGWKENSPFAARYLNRAADSGAPTGVKIVLVKPAKKVRMVARTLGDEAIDLAAVIAASGGIEVVATITNDTVVERMCMLFPAGDIKIKGPTTSGRTKLIARGGVTSACPGLVLAPHPALPPAPSAPYLYFDGASPSDLAALSARISDPATAGYFASFRGFVDAALGSLAGASDDTLARVAKAAGLLHVLGETPPGGSGFVDYAEVAVTALLGIGDRTALDSVEEFVTPPPNLLNVLQDSGRLQSICEAYDFVRGTSLDPTEDSAIRDLVATWADAFVQDWNLIGDPFGLFAGHRDNWAIKGGAALVTAALAFPDHPSAPVWLDAGLVYVNESLAEAVAAPGWYVESPHYVNYSLNNLASTAWHVRNATGVDWFDDLAPLVDTALALRQPDGQSAPFEEGVPNDFPHNVLAAAYPSRAPRMLWAWENSAAAPVNYDNQQIHSVTRFLVVDLSTVPVAPGEPSTVFLGGDSNAVALRSDWSATATQITSITAVDQSDAEVFESRHNTENPLDLTFFAAGATLLPTASGGPQVTSSVNRAVYLAPTSKNIPLVDGDAPYLLDPLAIAMRDRLDSADAGGVTHRILDVARTHVSEFAPGVNVARTVALVEDLYGVVVDHFESAVAHDYAATWRGRGDATVRLSLPRHHAVDYDWPSTAGATAHLAIDVTAGADLAGVVDSGLYAPAWGVEETLAPLRTSATATTLYSLAVLRGRSVADPATAITEIGSGDVAGFRIDDAAGEVTVATRGGLGFVTGGVDSDALLAVVRRQLGETTSLAMVGGTRIAAAASLESDRVATVSLATDGVAIVVTLSQDAAEGARLTVSNLPGVDGGLAYTASLDGVPLAASAFVQDGASFELRLSSGGTVVIEPVP